MRTKTSRRGRRVRKLRVIPALAVAAVLVAAAVVVVVAPRDPGPPPITYVLSHSADPANGHALAQEAIANVRGMERFRFTQVVTGAGSDTDPQNGQVEGEVDLANAPADKPKVRSKLQLQRPDATEVVLEQVIIDEDVHLKVPKKDNSAGDFKRSPKKAQKSKGKNPSSGLGQVDVVDPVMQLLEPVDTLPAEAFGQPAETTLNGNKTWEVTVNGLPGGAELTLFIDDAEHLVRRLEFVRNGRTATFDLTAFGATDIDIDDPAGS